MRPPASPLSAHSANPWHAIGTPAVQIARNRLFGPDAHPNAQAHGGRLSVAVIMDCQRSLQAR